MRLLESQNRIRELMAFFVAQVKLANERIDINLVSETVLIPLFAEIYGYKDLQNLNLAAAENYPGIDLGDEITKVAIQVTATANGEKVKDTLRKFVQYKLYERYDRLVVYILTEKQHSYSGKGYQEIIQGHFSFDKDADILDASDVLRQVNSFQLDKTRRIERFLEANFGNGTVPWYQEPAQLGTEPLYCNLLELFFPEEVYVADIDIDRDQVIKGSKKRKIRINKRSSTRNIVRAALEQQDWQFGVDWICHEGKIVTFHDLADPTIPLTRVIDAGTVTPFGSTEFYEIDENYGRVFKHLLRRCMQQKLYHQGVSWQNQERLYIFTGENNERKRTEIWYSKKKSSRTVYECTMKSQEPDKIWYCRHLAFRTEFKHLGDQWYVLIKPDWFFSYDGYQRSYYHAQKVDWLKKRERNPHVLNHVRFIAYFLKHGKPSDLFVQRPVYPFLSFGELLSFDSAPILDDKDWRQSEPKVESRSVLPLFEDL